MYEMKKGVSADIERIPNYEGNKSSSSFGVLPLSLPLNLGLQSQSEVASTRFWAVLIGIDGYPYYPLHGCVSDAKLMEKYLIEDLSVPKNRIQLLLGASGGEVNLDLDAVSSPTRANILRTLYSLIDNPEITPGDNIIIYFAGHGSRYAAKEYYRGRTPPGVSLASIRPIEALCPVDRTPFDSTGSPIPDISDREINAIFTQLSLTKGHRITLILDCCYSGVHTKSSPGGRTRSAYRTVPPLPRASIGPMLEGANQALMAFPEYSARCSVAAPDWQPDTGSHVVLAACQEYQFAQEEVEEDRGFHGVFTSALVQAFQSGQLKRGSMYVDIIRALPQWPHQIPVVAGDHKEGPIWYQE
ncbi:caspase domain-containing protein [Desarmillaria tabescens]|uniref:Caspase domain-containing protein n=1 Tax=Armillaria tabescens TaxID=1929756 RepID=A0AA39KBV6_ARMTA|nr:caspase domain-containing protein [Desarmillaria tabescens]KAK0458302.1 caspase domain-containing protein [Desarmillaria tabescens]